MDLWAGCGNDARPNVCTLPAYEKSVQLAAPSVHMEQNIIMQFKFHSNAAPSLLFVCMCVYPMCVYMYPSLRIASCRASRARCWPRFRAPCALHRISICCAVRVRMSLSMFLCVCVCVCACMFLSFLHRVESLSSVLLSRFLCVVFPPYSTRRSRSVVVGGLVVGQRAQRVQKCQH